MKNYTPEVMVERFVNKLNKSNIGIQDWQRQELLTFFNHYDLRVFIQNDHDRLTSLIIYQLRDYTYRWSIMNNTKANTLPNLQARYGEEEGSRRYQLQAQIKSTTHKSKLNVVDQFLKTNAGRIHVPITESIKKELQTLLNNYHTLGIKRIYDWQNAICTFINLGLENYQSRIARLIPIKKALL